MRSDLGDALFKGTGFRPGACDAMGWDVKVVACGGRTFVTLYRPPDDALESGIAVNSWNFARRATNA